MKFRAGMIVAFGLAVGACGQEGLESDYQDFDADYEAEAVSTGRSYWAHMVMQANAAYYGSTYGGTIQAFRVNDAVGLLTAEITDGPSLRDVTCTREAVAGCELQICEESEEAPAPFISVGPIRFSGSSFETELLPSGDQYAQAILFGEPLWGEPGEFVEISYTDENGDQARTRQAAPATGLSMTQHLPAEVDRRRAETILWTGAQPGDRGSMALHIMGTDGVPTANGGVLPRYSLSCSLASTRAGRFVLKPSMMSRLPAGSYVALAQSESVRVDLNGVVHTLLSQVENNFTPVVVK